VAHCVLLTLVTIALIRRTRQLYPRSSLFVFSTTVLHVLISAFVPEDMNGVEIILTRRQTSFQAHFNGGRRRD